MQQTPATIVRIRISLTTQNVIGLIVKSNDIEQYITLYYFYIPTSDGNFDKISKLM